ncbi:MAG: hypothetical protein ABIL02_00410 [candidate division WOR-3 bacterium]
MYKKIFNKVFWLIKDEEGQGMVEYIIIVIVIAIAALVAFRLLGRRVTHKASEAAQSIQNLGTPGGNPPGGGPGGQ